MLMTLSELIYRGWRLVDFGDNKIKLRKRGYDMEIPGNLMIEATVVEGCDGEKEVTFTIEAEIGIVGNCVYIELDDFTDPRGKTIADLLVGKYWDKTEKIVDKLAELDEYDNFDDDDIEYRRFNR